MTCVCACVRVRLGSFDLKVFCELRPGLIGWAVLNLGMMAKEKQVKGHVSTSMMLVNAFQVRVLFIPHLMPPLILLQPTWVCVCSALFIHVLANETRKHRALSPPSYALDNLSPLGLPPRNLKMRRAYTFGTPYTTSLPCSRPWT